MIRRDRSTIHTFAPPLIAAAGALLLLIQWRWGRMLWLDTNRLVVEVERGEVVLRGQLDTELEAELLEKRVMLVPGVVGVRSQLTWPVDRKGHRVEAGRS